jgi:hypothetical protein
MKRVFMVLTCCLVSVTDASAQSEAHTDYLRAVAKFFSLPTSEVAILGDWQLEVDEIPVVLFVARRAGVSPEALVALRSAGQSWVKLTGQYRVKAPALYVPVRDDVPAGALEGAYQQFRGAPVSGWGDIKLTDPHIIGLVNLRVISQSLGLSAEQVLGETSNGLTYVELHAQLSR